MKNIVKNILIVTGYRFPKTGIFGRDTKTRELLEIIIGCSCVRLNFAADFGGF